jgi:di/tripeptidase
MPRRGEGRAQFKLRPIDIRGHELGQEVTTVISEHHAAIRRMREAEEEEREMRLYGRAGRYGRGDDNGNGGQPQVIVEAPPSSDGTEHMGHAMDRMLDVVESRAKALEEALEMERSRVRDEEKQRAQERIDLATNAAAGERMKLMRHPLRNAHRTLAITSVLPYTFVDCRAPRLSSPAIAPVYRFPDP